MWQLEVGPMDIRSAVATVAGRVLLFLAALTILSALELSHPRPTPEKSGAEIRLSAGTPVLAPGSP